MVNYDTVLIRFGELSTKGKNRKEKVAKLERRSKTLLTNGFITEIENAK